MKTYFPQAALEGFGNALAYKLGVSIEYTTGQPRTDGRTVYLPQIMSALDQAEFESLCGVAVHEAAHVYFGTWRQMARYAVDALHAACFNAVVDVADETRIEGVFGRARHLLDRSNWSAHDKIEADDALTNGDPVWAVLAVGIICARLGRCPVYRLARQHQHWALMGKAYRILWKCRARRSRKIPGRKRTAAQWNALRKAADALVDLLRHLGDASGAPQIQFGPAGAPADIGTPAVSPAVGPTDKLAGYADGALLADDAPAPAGSGAGSSGEDSVARAPMNEATYRALRPSLIGAVERMAITDEADGLSGGFYSGPRLGRDIERAAIDGRCFARKNDEGEHLHAAVLLDASGSMEDELAEVSAVAQAFLDALTPVARSVHPCTFGTGVVPVPDFKDPSKFASGGTRTDDALAWASARLKGQPGRRACVVITDGDPYSSEWTIAACRELQSHRVQIIGIAYKYPAGPISRSLPGAYIVAANDPATLAAQLAQVARKVAAA